MKRIHYFIIIILSLFLFTNCNEDFPEITPIVLTDFTENVLTTPYTADYVKGLLQDAGLNELAEGAIYEVKIYSLRYKTTFKGQAVEASGLIAIPIPLEKKDKFPIMSYQHGVITRNDDAPTSNINRNPISVITYLASTGMIVLIPDYIGFGSTNDKFHPFMCKDANVIPVIDMIKASKEFVISEKLCQYNEKLFLAGHSEGGSLTLATLSAIENSSKYSDLTVTASACCSGIYNLLEFQNWMAVQPRYEQPLFIVYMLESFSAYENLDIDYSLVFSDAFAPSIHGMIDGTKTNEEINSQFGTYHVGELFNDDFEDPDIFNNDPKYSQLKQLFINNSVPSWNLKSDVTLYYGKDDIWVPGDQTLIMYNEFRTIGATTKIKINAMDGIEHNNATIPMLTKAVTRFKNY